MLNGDLDQFNLTRCWDGKVLVAHGLDIIRNRPWCACKQLFARVCCEQEAGQVRRDGAPATVICSFQKNGISAHLGLQVPSICFKIVASVPLARSLEP